MFSKDRQRSGSKPARVLPAVPYDIACRIAPALDVQAGLALVRTCRELRELGEMVVWQNVWIKEEPGGVSSKGLISRLKAALHAIAATPLVTLLRTPASRLRGMPVHAALTFCEKDLGRARYFHRMQLQSDTPSSGTALGVGADGTDPALLLIERLQPQLRQLHLSSPARLIKATVEAPPTLHRLHLLATLPSWPYLHTLHIPICRAADTSALKMILARSHLHTLTISPAFPTSISRTYQTNLHLALRALPTLRRFAISTDSVPACQIAIAVMHAAPGIEHLAFDLETRDVSPRMDVLDAMRPLVRLKSVSYIQWTADFPTEKLWTAGDGLLKATGLRVE